MSASLAMALLLLAAPKPNPGAAAADADRMGQKALSASMPVYPGATDSPVPVGDTLQANGVPMNVQSFMTDDPPKKVLDFYKAHFEKFHLPMLGNGQLEGMHFPYPSITVFDELNEVELSVIAIPSPDRHTMVLLARADMRPIREALDHAEAGRFGGLPVYPSGRNPSAVEFTDGEVKRTQVTFDTSDPADQVLAFYEKAFAQAGAEQGQSEHPGERVFHLPDGAWRISAAFDADSRTTIVRALHGDDPAGPGQIPAEAR